MDPALTVLYDEDCGFCRVSLSLLLRWDVRKRLLPEPIQSETGQRLLASMPEARRLESAHAVDAAGRVWSGGDAVAPIARVLPAGLPVALLARALAAPTRAGYVWVAGHRTPLGRRIPQGAKERATERIARHREAVRRRAA